MERTLKNRLSISEKTWQVGVGVAEENIPGRRHLEKKYLSLIGCVPRAQRDKVEQTELGDLVIQSKELALGLVGNREPLKKHFSKFQPFI